MIFIMLSVLLFSYNNVLWKKNLKVTSIPFLVAYRAFFTSTISIGFLLIFFTIEHISIADFIKITTGSLFGVLGLFSMLAVIKKASLQWLGIYNLLGVVFTILYLWIFDTVPIKESLLGLLFIVSGFVCFIFSNKQTQLKITFKQHLILLLMSFSYSSSAIFHWKNLNLNFSPLLIIANQESIVFFVGLLFTFKKVNMSSITTGLRIYFKKIVIMSTVVFFAILFSFLGLKQTNPIVSSLLFLAAPLTTILFSALFFKEKFSKKNIVFIIIILVGTFMLHFHNN
ncbi:MAG: drug/metabolite transporter (DMT)-like permease [Polaribacter sp.]|jgi:drug/metabolite transporter (DMT)-like permease